MRAESQWWNSLPGTPSDVISVLNRVRDSFEQAAITTGPSEVRSYLNQAVGVLQQKNGRIILSTAPKGQFLLGLSKRFPDCVHGACSYLSGVVESTYPGNPNYLGGIVAAVLYINPDAVSAAAAAQVQAFELERANIEDFRNRLASEWSDPLEKNRGEFQNEHADVNAQLKDSASTFASSHAGWGKQIEGLETLYKEKLRLEQPAKYWKDLEDTYTQQGRWWAVTTIAITGVLVTLVGLFVYNPPALLNSAAFTLSGFKGAVALGAGVSMLIYLINILARMWTSSLHLARDARERYQLTHVYLALAKDGAVSEKDKEIVLSALFSRADTGLLKHDASPELPLAAIATALRNRP